MRKFPLFLAVVMAVSLIACSSNAVSSPSQPESVSQSAPVEPVPEPEEPAQKEKPELIVSPGVECKTVITWSRDKEQITIGPRCGKLQTCFCTRDGSCSLLGFDLETGEMVDFCLPLEEKTNVLEVPGREGEFILQNGTSRRSFRWTDGQLRESSEYLLPEKVQSRVTIHSDLNWKTNYYYWQTYQQWGTDYYWDALPAKDLLAWCEGSGVWLSRIDGSGAYLAIPFRTVFDLPDLAEDRNQNAEMFQLFDREPIEVLRDPHLLNDGRTLVVAAHSDAAFAGPYAGGFVYGYVVLDIPTGEVHWYKTGPLVKIEWIDDTTVRFGNTLVDLVSGTEQDVLAVHRFKFSSQYADTRDYIHYFSNLYEKEISYYVTYLLEEADKEKNFHELMAEGKAIILLQAKDSLLYHLPAIDENQCLCSYIAEEKESILFLTV